MYQLAVFLHIIASVIGTSGSDSSLARELLPEPDVPITTMRFGMPVGVPEFFMRVATPAPSPESHWIAGQARNDGFGGNQCFTLHHSKFYFHIGHEVHPELKLYVSGSRRARSRLDLCLYTASASR